MSDIITVQKIGVGTENDPFRPDTDVKWWEVVEERETEFDIRIRN